MFWDDIQPEGRILAEKVGFGGKLAKFSENHVISCILPEIPPETYAFPCATATFCAPRGPEGAPEMTNFQ